MRQALSRAPEADGGNGIEQSLLECLAKIADFNVPESVNTKHGLDGLCQPGGDGKIAAGLVDAAENNS